MFNFMKKAETATIVTEAQTEQAQKSFTDIRAKWKALSADRKITKEDIAALCIYRSLIAGEGKEGAISRLKKSFKPITNPVKLENGMDPYGALKSAIWGTRHSVVLTWLEPQEKAALQALATELQREKF
jgi:hypothetical protein